MHICFDTQYLTQSAVVAGVLFQSWTDAEATHSEVLEVPNAAEYRSGEFYRRELPGIMSLYKRLNRPFDTIVIDGYVWLEIGRPGLGAHLYNALDCKVPVIGVAKTAFGKAAAAVSIHRGASKRPLYVTAAGMALPEASMHIQDMNGEHRLPTLIKKVDALCRGKIG